MRFFARFVFISNLSFLVTIAMRFIEFQNDNAVVSKDAVGFSPLKSTFIILGYGAVVFNLAFLFILLLNKVLKRENQIPMWLTLSNFFFFVIQLLYFFN